MHTGLCDIHRLTSTPSDCSHNRSWSSLVEDRCCDRRILLFVALFWKNNRNHLRSSSLLFCIFIPDATLSTTDRQHRWQSVCACHPVSSCSVERQLFITSVFRRSRPNVERCLHPRKLLSLFLLRKLLQFLFFSSSPQIQFYHNIFRTRALNGSRRGACAEMEDHCP